MDIPTYITIPTSVLEHSYWLATDLGDQPEDLMCAATYLSPPNEDVLSQRVKREREVDHKAFNTHMVLCDLYMYLLQGEMSIRIHVYLYCILTSNVLYLSVIGKRNKTILSMMTQV